jgi:hypothetical protein
VRKIFARILKWQEIRRFWECLMRFVARVLIDESHRQAWTIRPEMARQMNPVSPADSSYVGAAEVLRRRGLEVDVHTDGAITAATLEGIDVLVLPHCSEDEWETTTGVGSPLYADTEIKAIESFVAAGGGLVLLAETEQPKYGNNLAAIAAKFGVEMANATAMDPVHSHAGVPTWVLADLIPSHGQDITTQVAGAAFYRSGTLTASHGHVFARTSSEAKPAGAGLAVALSHGDGRVVVLADSDLFGDDSISDLSHKGLWLNIVVWAAGAPSRASTAHPDVWLTSDESWQQLTAAVEDLRSGTNKDGSLDWDRYTRERAQGNVEAIIASIEGLLPRFEHQAEHLRATIVDLNRWAAADFAVPDFMDSLLLFRPDLARRDGVEHLVVFPMYTQNGNPDRNMEAVVCRTFWPDWLAELEASTYGNPAFVPIEFVGFTSGYNTHSAVLFPETVATRETPVFHWGGIFCDREAARFRTVTQSASELLNLTLPPEAARLVSDQALAQETFVLWDLIHDRTHSHGDLPFDPFMIKQRMPFWMYALEELRCDLTTFRETVVLDDRGVHLGRYVRYAIVFDRLFRFPITGARVRNYDGLGGQIMFGWLHRRGVIRWRDNTFTIDWDLLTDSIVELCAEVETLYREGIDRSRTAHWLAAYEFVSAQVAPNPASTWAKGPDALPLDGEPKGLVDAVMPDEFPLNVFYEALRKKLSAVIDSTAGIAA